MPPRMDLCASSIGELVSSVRTIAETWSPGIVEPQELWFRGQKRRDFALLPGLYRADNQKYHYDEGGLFERFKVLATPHVAGRLENEWAWYFLAQHYGLPTRLLDWTENLLAAAYFAVCESIYCRDRLALDALLVKGRQPSVFEDDSPAIWVLDAGTVNKAACEEDTVFVAGLDFTARYLPDGVSNKLPENCRPIALMAPRANERIVAQQGAFTIHGHDRLGLEADSEARGVRLARITLDGANLAFLWEELQLCGLSRHALFPSIQTAAELTIWQMQSAQPNR